MSTIDAQARKRLSSRTVRLQATFACTLSILAIVATAGTARAQQTQAKQLPTVPVEPPPQAQPKAETPKAATKAEWRQ